MDGFIIMQRTVYGRMSMYFVLLSQLPELFNIFMYPTFRVPFISDFRDYTVILALLTFFNGPPLISLFSLFYDRII